MPPMPSAVSVSFARLSAAAALLTSFPASAALQEDPGAVLEPVGEVPPLPEPVAGALPTVRVTVVGKALSTTTLEQALGRELQSSYTLRFSSAHRFVADDFFRNRTDSSTRIHVWVDVTRSGAARLYFANREGTRYLVRTLELSESLDEMDREALAQAIEWSLQALVEGNDGLTRAEAQALLSVPDESPPPPPKKEESTPAELPTDRWRRKTGWLPELAFLHGWAPHSAELPATQGPALRLALDWLTRGHQFGFTASAQYQYPQRHAESGIALQLQGVASRLDARYLATRLVDGSGIGLRVGFGFDAVFSSHEALDWTRFETTEDRWIGVPLVSSGLVWQIPVEPRVRVELSVGAEIDLVSVRYDVVTIDDTTTLLSRWPARPSASVGIALF